MSESTAAYMQVMVSTAAYITDPAPLTGAAFDAALGRREAAFSTWFGTFAREVWPALQIAQCHVAAIDCANYDAGEIRFSKRDGALALYANVDTPSLARLPLDARVDQVFRIALVVLAAAFEKYKVDAQPLLAWCDAHLLQAGDVSIPTPAKTGAAVKLAPRRAAASGDPDIDALLPLVRLYGRDGKHRTFHFAWFGDDESGGESLVEVSGTVGEPSDARVRPLAKRETGRKAVAAAIAPSWQAGMRPVDGDDYVDLQIDYPIVGMGTEQDLEQRHELEEEFGDVLMSTGLGYVDGGEIGSGEMSVLCTVVDGVLAKTVLERYIREENRPVPTRIAIDD